MIVPGQVTRSEGEKVRAGDDVLLKSVSYDRFLCADTEFIAVLTAGGFQSQDLHSPISSQAGQSSNVIASFNKTLWGLQLFTSNTAREQDLGQFVRKNLHND